MLIILIIKNDNNIQNNNNNNNLHHESKYNSNTFFETDFLRESFPKEVAVGAEVVVFKFPNVNPVLPFQKERFYSTLINILLLFTINNRSIT